MNRKAAIAAGIILSALAAAPLVQAADLVNINTADSVTLQTLTGIGPSKAQAIIDYRTQNGSFAAVSDIQNVSGIGPSTYANIKDFITVTGGAQQTTQTQTQGTSTSSSDSAPTVTQTQTQATGGVVVPSITARIATDVRGIAGAGTVFDGSAFDAGGQPLVGARYLWNFGDGTAAEGAHVEHTYAYPGTYEVGLSVGYNYSSATALLALPVVAAQVSLVAEGDGSLTIYNHDASDLNIGWWSLRQGTSTFMFPEGTIVLAGKGVRFAPSVLRFVGDEHAALYYINGAQAAAASVGSNSPLRGQVVSMSTAKQAPSGYADLPAGKSAEVGSPPLAKPPSGASSPSQGTSTLYGIDQAAAAAAAPWDIQWVYVGLFAIIAIGAWGAYYAHPVVLKHSETFDEASEFEIEE